MRLLNEDYIEIFESDIDLTLGEVYNTTIIKSDATPIDNITKFAWADEDYEEVNIYHKYTEDELAMRRNDMPTAEERITALEAALLELMGVTIDG
jgi:hypothetical protein